jgi:predicted ribosome quality control (RQC) complex YloA/Tae2 family protein
MSMNLKELDDVLEEAEPRARGRTVLGFRDAGPDTFMLILEGEHPQILRFLISVHPGLDRAHLTPRRSPRKNRVKPTPFSARVQEKLEGLRMEEMAIEGKDRVLGIRFKGYRLVAELIGRHANLLLLDEENRIIELYRTFRGKARLLEKGAAYLPLPAPLRAKRDKRRFDAGSEPAWSEAPLNGAADVYFLEMENEAREEGLKNRLAHHVKRKVKKLEQLMARLDEEAAAARDADHYKACGDLLQANFHRMKRGQARIEVEDLYTGGERSIPLDREKDPSENIAVYYKRYKKLKSSVEHLEQRKLVVASDLERLKEAGARIAEGGDLEGLAGELGVELEKREARRKKPGKPAEEGRKYVTSDGLFVLVGRDNTSNDRLTFRAARGNDMWLHCQEAAGSHVILRVPKGKPAPLNSLIDAGHLAVHFSKRRGADLAEVIYTPRKYVRKIRGGPAGKVTVERFKTLNIRRDSARLEALLATAR